MDLNKLTIGDKVIGGAGIFFLLTMFLPWFGAGGGSRSGWDYFFTGLIPLLLIVAVTATVLVTKLADGVTLPDLPLPLSMILLIVAGVATFLVLVRVVIGDSIGLGFGDDFDLSRKFGIFFALLGAIGVVVGAVLKLQEGDDAPTSGTTPPQPF